MAVAAGGRQDEPIPGDRALYLFLPVLAAALAMEYFIMVYPGRAEPPVTALDKLLARWPKES